MKKLFKWSASVVVLASSLMLVSCSLHPGGLSDEEWNSLSPARRAELTMQQQSLVEQQMHDTQENEHWNKLDNKQRSSGSTNWDREAKKDLNKAMKKNHVSVDELNKL